MEWLLHEYARRVDAGDLEGVGELFAHGTYRAAVGDETAVFEGAAAVATLLRSMVIIHEDGTPSTKHQVTNVAIDVDDGDGTASARSSYTVLQARPDLPLQPVVTGRYDDHFERVEGRWRFADRLIHTDLVGDLTHHLRSDPFAD